MKRSSSSSRRTRGLPTTASGFRGRDRAGPVPLRSPLVSSVLSQSDFEVFEPSGTLPDDRRSHIPTEPRSGLRQRAKTPALRFSGLPARVISAPPQKRSTSRGRPFPRAGSAALLFQAPKSVAVCVQRGRRKEVLHALGIAGGKVRPGKYGPFSKVRCR